jgi:hypothetical protein
MRAVLFGAGVIAVAQKSGPERRTGDRRVRQVYHEVDRRSGGERRAAEREVLVRERGDGLGLFGRIIIVLVALFLVDAFVWQGYYRHAMWASINANATSVREWSDSAWR